jgi:hypothetical protein
MTLHVSSLQAGLMGALHRLFTTGRLIRRSGSARSSDRTSASSSLPRGAFSDYGSNGLYLEGRSSFDRSSMVSSARTRSSGHTPRTSGRTPSLHARILNLGAWQQFGPKEESEEGSAARIVPLREAHVLDGSGGPVHQPDSPDLDTTSAVQHKAADGNKAVGTQSQKGRLEQGRDVVLSGSAPLSSSTVDEAASDQVVISVLPTNDGGSSAGAGPSPFSTAAQQLGEQHRTPVMTGSQHQAPSNSLLGRMAARLLRADPASKRSRLATASNPGPHAHAPDGIYDTPETSFHNPLSTQQRTSSEASQGGTKGNPLVPGGSSSRLITVGQQSVPLPETYSSGTSSAFGRLSADPPTPRTPELSQAQKSGTSASNSLPQSGASERPCRLKQVFKNTSASNLGNNQNVSSNGKGEGEHKTGGEQKRKPQVVSQAVIQHMVGDDGGRGRGQGCMSRCPTSVPWQAHQSTIQRLISTGILGTCDNLQASILCLANQPELCFACFLLSTPCSPAYLPDAVQRSTCKFARDCGDGGTLLFRGLRVRIGIHSAIELPTATYSRTQVTVDRGIG